MIALGCDHGGYELKQEIIKYLEEHNLEYTDFGCDSLESTDYPIYAKRVAIAVQSGDCDLSLIHIQRDPRSAVFRLLQRRGNKTSQQCKYPCNGWKSCRTWTCSQDRRYVPEYSVLRRRAPYPQDQDDGRRYRHRGRKSGSIKIR